MRKLNKFGAALQRQRLSIHKSLGNSAMPPEKRGIASSTPQIIHGNLGIGNLDDMRENRAQRFDVLFLPKFQS